MQTSCSGNPTVSFHAYTKLGGKTFDEQTLNLRLWANMVWAYLSLQSNTEVFCGITFISVPTGQVKLW